VRATRTEAGSPVEQLRARLVAARRDGLPFIEGWDVALGSIVWPSLRQEAEWKSTLTATREAWQAAYEDWPQEPREAAARELARIYAEDAGDLRPVAA
jgi:hypothetical protein